MLAPTPRGKPKGSKNQTSAVSTAAVSIAFDEPPPSFAPSVMTKTIKSGRAVKETTVWEQESQPRRRFRGSTLEVVAFKPARKSDCYYATMLSDYYG